MIADRLTSIQDKARKLKYQDDHIHPQRKTLEASYQSVSKQTERCIKTKK